MILIPHFLKSIGSFTVLLVLFFNLSESFLYCKCNDHNNCLSNENHQLGNASNFYCVIKGKGHCFSARVTNIDESVQPPTAHIVKRYGCLSTDTKSILSCNGHYFNSTIPVAIACCNKTVFCNAQLHPQFYNYASDQEAIDYARSHLRTVTGRAGIPGQGGPGVTVGTVMMVVCVCVLLVCVSVCIAVVCYCRQRLHWASKQVMRGGAQEAALLAMASNGTAATVTTVTTRGGGGSLMTASSLLTNATGAGARLVQRTLGHQLLFQHHLGRGRFSEVWAGEWLGELVAVRHLQQRQQLQIGGIHEQLWLRTVELYFSWPLQHAHVSALLGSDRMPAESATCPCPPLALVLIYPYYHWGSLARLMASSHWDLSAHAQPPSPLPNSRLNTLARMAHSLAAGLCYLHTEIAATKGKPAIAHRNLKSSNVYVKDDYSCCIGDLEWALAGGSKDDDRCNIDSQLLPQLPSPNGLVQYPDFEYYVTSILISSDCRYVAPELLEAAHPSHTRLRPPASVDEHKKCDMYSLSLILWELLVWFEPRLKRPPPPTADDNHDDDCDDRTAPAFFSASDWFYEPAYQAELVALRQSAAACNNDHHDDDDDHNDDARMSRASLAGEPRPLEMRELVLARGLRPAIDGHRVPAADAGAPGIVELLCQVIPQCWCSQPDSRLGALKVKKYLSQLSE